MKTKTITAVINKKFDAWLESIQDEATRNLVKKNTILTGGSIASMLLREPVNDFDFYFRNKQTAMAVAQYYANTPEAKERGSFSIEEKEDRVVIRVHSTSVDEVDQTNTAEGGEASAYEKEMLAAAAKESKTEQAPYKVLFMSNNAISLSGDVQIVARFFGEPEEIHANYDFVHATNYWTSWDRVVVLRADALECLLTRELRYIGSKYPICSIIRTRKFLTRGFTINAGQYLKMCLQVNELNLKDVNDLREQIAGVDVAYFSQVLTALKDKDPEKINSAYLVEILNRIFG